MKCPYCGYDKIQPNFNFCPKCKRGLKESREAQHVEEHNENSSQEKGFINRAFSRWTYDRAYNDPYGYASWALRNPNDNRVFLDRWNREGNDLTIIRNAIADAIRARQENPSTDPSEIDESIIDSNQQTIRQERNRSFVQAVNDAYTTDAAAIVRNKAIWKLQSGELARHIAPDEWVYVSEHLEGLIIEEGTSAIIYVDGQEVAQMGSGMYVFDDKHAAAAEIEAERRRNEHQGLFSRMADSIYRFFTGHKREESAKQREERKRRIQQIISKLKKDTIIDVYLKSDIVFPALFGQNHLSDNPQGYQPYTIQSRYLDIQVGVSMQLRIGNFKEFIANYLAGKKTINIIDVVKSADNSVYSILRFQLRDVEVSERGLDEQTFNAIKHRLIQNLPNILHGVEVVDVLDIATTNEQLARFRDVEEQLYCTEREYDFLKRTNEFRNRIASEENSQKIREARSEQELRFLLDEVNKDNLLHAEEMDQFVSLLQNQKIIREATNKADLDKALNEIEHNRLISQEEFDIFKNDFDNRAFDRNQVSEQLRARSLMATSIAKLEVDKMLSIANIRNADEISDVEWEAFRKQKGHEAEGWDLEATIYGRRFILERQQLIDEGEKRRLENENDAVKIAGERQRADFVREGTLKDHELDEKIKDDEYHRVLREKEDELRLLREKIELELSKEDREAQRALENLRAIKEMELTEMKEKHAHEQALKDKDVDLEKVKLETESKMAADQLLGKNIANMDAAAQTKFAESFSHLNEIELTKANAQQQAEMYEKMVAMAQANGINTQELQAENARQQMDFMKKVLETVAQMSSNQNQGQQDLVSSMVGAMQSVATGKINDAQAMKEEYRGEKHHAESRLDENQHQSLNYTTRVKVSENMPFVAGGTSVNVNVGTRTCPVCGQPLDDDMNICPICGHEIK